MLCSLMEDNHMPKALGLEYNWRNRVGGEKRKASLLACGTAAATALALLPQASASGAVPPAKKQRGESSNAPLPGQEQAAELDELDAAAEADDVDDEQEVKVDSEEGAVSTNIAEID
jgi:hypothetical protein